MTESIESLLKYRTINNNSYNTISSNDDITTININGNNNEHDIILSPAKPVKYPWPFYNGQETRRYDRIIDRDGEFHQSKGKISIRKRIKSTEWRAIYAGDWFHSLINAPTSRIVAILLSAYVFMIIIFALLYYYISLTYGCNMGLAKFHQAFMFSLETMATIGYGTQDIFFDSCWLPMIVITMQVCVKLISDAITIGVLYCRIARPQGRASTILFSNHAIIRRIRGKLFFMFQICELRKHQLVEAHVRVYVIKHEVDPLIAQTNSQLKKNDDGKHDEQKFMSYFQTCTMRLSHPNDELGGMLLLCLPQLIVHEMNSLSPIVPPPIWYSSTDKKLHKFDPNNSGLYMEPENHSNRRNDPNNNINDYHRDNFDKRYFPNNNQKVDSNDNMKQDSNGMKDFLNTFSTPSSLNDNNNNNIYKIRSRLQQEKLMTQLFMNDRRVEIVAIVEGVDAASGGVVQARHSFTCEEIIWDKAYKPCVFEDGEDGSAIIDFSLFHELVDVPEDASFAGPVSSQL